MRNPSLEDKIAILMADAADDADTTSPARLPPGSATPTRSVR